MKNYRLLIQYDGGRYKGWQRLGNGENTIQGRIESVLTKLCGQEIEIIGASRTDAGVHAIGQVANFKTKENIAEDEVKSYLNKNLPEDISIKEVKRVSENFHSRYNTKDKTYLYKIWNRDYSNPFIRKYSMQIKDKLNIIKMKQASQFLLGEHDFTAFTNAKSKTKSMVREIYSLDIEERDGLIEIRVRGDGFLHNMVRRIVGTLIKIGLGEIEASAIPEILNSMERKQAGFMADACGLYLEKIEY